MVVCNDSIVNRDQLPLQCSVEFTMIGSRNTLCSRVSETSSSQIYGVIDV